MSPAPGPRHEHVVSGVDGAARVVDYMKDRLAVVPVTEIGDLITSGFVNIVRDGVVVLARTFDPVTNGVRIDIDAAALARLEAAARWNPPWDQALPIRFEDEDLLVVEKPAGMHVHPLGDKREHTLINALVHHAGARPGKPWAGWRPHVVQRLDCVVSGLLAVAKNAAAKDVFVRAQKKREIVRTYSAMVTAIVESDEGVVDAPLGREPGRGYRRAIVAVEDGGLTAITRWKVLERFGDRTLLEVHPETGRTHQIRVHLAGLGHPIVGDHLYASPGTDGVRLGEAEVTPIALHSTRLRLRHPRSGVVMEWESVPAFHQPPYAFIS
jgi:23S rRNA pseudouridine1911/1915/1917 synthase